MTAMKDAMKKAGVDTARAELLTKAADVLRAHGGDATKATAKFSGMLHKRPDLLDALALDYLRRVAADMPNRKHKRPRQSPRPRSQEEKNAALHVAASE